MSQNVSAIPPNISTLLDTLVEQFQHVLRSNLVGVYLHGSLAMGCFNPRSSDIDFLVVVNDPLKPTAKQQIISFILPLSDQAPAKGFEFSVILLDSLHHFVYPTPFELHFSNLWKPRYQAGAVDFEAQMTDPDLAAHIVITRERGICLYGQPIAQVFPRIPADYYLASIMNDADDILANITQNPVYGVLNLCRVLAYKQHGLITSKREGGEWALTHLDPRYHPLIAHAIRDYQSATPSDQAWNEPDLQTFAAYFRSLL